MSWKPSIRIWCPSRYVAISAPSVACITSSISMPGSGRGTTFQVGFGSSKEESIPSKMLIRYGGCWFERQPVGFAFSGSIPRQAS